MVAETALSASQLMQPLFIVDANGEPQPLDALPGQHRWPVSHADSVAEGVRTSGVRSVILFGLPATKDAVGSSASDPRGPVPRAIAAMRRAVPDLVIAADVCLCEYTDHGHCGIVAGDDVANDATLERLASAAVTYADAGADVVAPSAMMDGQVIAIRQALDAAGHLDVSILSYAAKYASAFYGPFREAVASAPSFGDRRGYQMDSRNRREAMREMLIDVREGADMIMVKPAGCYLDIIADARARLDVPIAAYQVSGEYAMLKAAAERGWIDERRAALESLVAIRRAGADLILTYYATTAARWLREDQ
jgi:porphobilinogen synthase